MTDLQPAPATEIETLGLFAVIDRLRRTGSADIPTAEFLHALKDLREHVDVTAHVTGQLIVAIDEYLTCDPHESDVAGEGDELALERHYWLNTAKEHADAVHANLAVLRPFFVRPTPPPADDPPPAEETTP